MSTAVRRQLLTWRAIPLVALVALVALAIAGPLVWGGAADRVDTDALAQGASSAHPFGTDALGRDVLARTLVATRLSLGLAVAAATIGFVLGAALGMLPLALGRRPGRFVASTIAVLVAFPSLLLALLVAMIIGIGATGAVAALAVALAPAIARLTQTLSAQVANADYVVAARSAGVRWPRLMIRHVFPNIAPPLVLQFAMLVGASILSLSALSYLGLGVQPPDYDWGRLLDEGLERIYVTPAAALGPALAIVLASLAFNVLGDVLADALAVESRDRGRGRRGAAPGEDGGPAAALPVSSVPDAVLQVEGLTVTFPSGDGAVRPVRDVGLVVRPGERLGIVGESGSGKSLTAMAVGQLLERPVEVEAAVLELDGEALAELSPRERERRLATSLAMVFQDPLSSLNPVLRIGRQITEAAEQHLGEPSNAARGRALASLRELRIGAAEHRFRQYPHELSGGMRQRAMIAMGLMTRPRVILADEPTTALDVTVQRQVLEVLRKVNDEHRTAIVLISHDISVIRSFCERVVVMYAGRIVEELDVRDLERASHPYTRALMAAVPTMETDRDAPLATIHGRPPAPDEVPPGCPFAPRCPLATDRCRAERPPLGEVLPGRRAACWYPQGVPTAAEAKRV